MDTTDTYEVVKYGQTIPIGDETLTTTGDQATLWKRYIEASPQQRQQWAREAAEQRAAARAASPTVPLTVDTLTSALHITQEFATHLVQPFCECLYTRNGWDYCAHAHDEGLAL